MSPQSEPSHVRDARDDFEARLLAEQNRHHEEFRQFAYAVSHDLREPIRMIASYTQLLDRRYQDQLDADGLEFMRYILEAAQRMDRLLGDLLTYSHQFRSAGPAAGIWWDRRRPARRHPDDRRGGRPRVAPKLLTIRCRPFCLILPS